MVILFVRVMIMIILGAMCKNCNKKRKNWVPLGAFSLISHDSENIEALKLPILMTMMLIKTANQNIARITAKLDQLLGVCGDHGCVVLVREQGAIGELQEFLQEL